METQPTQQKWYQSTGGAIFLGILIFLIIAATLFLILVGYFLYSMKYGNSAALFNKYGTDSTQEDIIDTSDMIYDHSPVLGQADAPVTILAFEDFECPYCRESYPILKAIEQKYGSAIRLIFKHSPLVSIHSEALLAHVAAECANNQGKFWDYYDLLYTAQKLDKDSLLGYAESLSIDNSQFQQCLETGATLDIVNQDLNDAGKIGLKGTPTFIVNGKLYEGTLSEQQWSDLILQELKQK